MIIKFLPENIVWEGNPGKNLMEIANEVGISLDGSCSGKGTCGKCKVIADNKSVLSCQFKPPQDMTITVASGKRVEMRKEDLNKLPDTFLFDKKSEKYSDDDYGISFDIGTTTVVGNLWNLKTNKNLGAYAMTNPQSIHGGDVISRISYSIEEEGNLQELNNLVITCLNKISKELTSKNNIDIKNIVKIVVVGNTTMSHIFINEDPKSLALAPFSPAYEGSVTGKLKDLGIDGAEYGTFFLVPGIAGHVGSDITAGIIAAGLNEAKGLILYIDIGTNGEIVLSNNGQMMTCSTAAGPAFEGASIEHGMRAAEGAIEKVSIQNDDVQIKTIGNADPVGICGSGIIDAVAQMVDKELVKKTGKVKDKYLVLTKNKKGEEISIRQKDIREVQLAKAAISSGIKMMLQRWDLTVDDIDQVIIAGAFGSHIDPESAKIIKVIPEVDSSHIKFLGNTAGIGASMILLSDKEKELSEKIVKNIKHLELASCEDFQDVYLKEMSF